MSVSATAPKATVAKTMLNTVLASSASEESVTPSASTNTSGPQRSHSRSGRAGSRSFRNGHSTEVVLDTTRSTSRRSVAHTDSSRVLQSRSPLVLDTAPSRTSDARKSRSTSSVKLPLLIAATPGTGVLAARESGARW